MKSSSINKVLSAEIGRPEWRCACQGREEVPRQEQRHGGFEYGGRNLRVVGERN